MLTLSFDFGIAVHKEFIKEGYSSFLKLRYCFTVVLNSGIPIKKFANFLLVFWRLHQGYVKDWRKRRHRYTLVGSSNKFEGANKYMSYLKIPLIF